MYLFHALTIWLEQRDDNECSIKGKKINLKRLKKDLV